MLGWLIAEIVLVLVLVLVLKIMLVLWKFKSLKGLNGCLIAWLMLDVIGKLKEVRGKRKEAGGGKIRCKVNSFKKINEMAKGKGQRLVQRLMTKGSDKANARAKANCIKRLWNIAKRLWNIAKRCKM